MTTYRIITPSFVGTLVASGDNVIQAAPVLHWTVGGSFTSARDYCRARGWQIEPLVEDTHPDWLEYDNILYSFHWDGDRLARITRHAHGQVEDITFDQLPYELGRAL